jgi:ferredoxin
MKVPVVDPDLCTGCGACVEICADVFEMGDDDIAAVKNPSGAGESQVQEAIDGCPAEAISWGEQ